VGGDWLDCGEDRLHGGDLAGQGLTGGARPESAARFDKRRPGADQGTGTGGPRTALGQRDPAQGVGVFRPGGAQPPVQILIAFIDEHRAVHGIEPICQVLPIAPSTYHAHVARRAGSGRASAWAKSDAELCRNIRRIWDENFQVYGVRKVWRQLRQDGTDVARGKAVKTTLSDRASPCPADPVNRQFQPSRPNALWVVDFTYGAPRPGWSGVHMTGMLMRKEENEESPAPCCEGA
jgi:putative transposase